jgi:DNA polymerase III sliding clamp (beta) subunit (PCNA family)
MTIREAEVEITAQSAEEGEGSEIVQADYKGEDITLGFNWQYLLEFLTNVSSVELEAVASETDSPEGTVNETDGDKVRVREGNPRTRIAFEFKDANAQTQMSIAGEGTYDYKYIVMPLRI